MFFFQLDEEEAKKKEQEEEFFDAEDEFFKEYRAKLMQQMQERFLNSYVRSETCFLFLLT